MDTSHPELECHPLSTLFPLLDGDDFDALVSDIRESGLRSPITLYENKILDGRNRYIACRQAGVPILTDKYEGNDPLGFALSANLHRRHLSTSQRAMVAAKLATLPKGSNQHAQFCAPSQQRAAELLGVGRRTVQLAAIVRQKAIPALAERVERDEVPVSMAAKVAELPVKEQNRLVTAGHTTLRNAVKASQRSKREIQLACKTEAAAAALGTKLYGVIYADPPWRFETWSENGKDRAADNHYPTMALHEICALGAPAADDCILFMWRPAPMADEAMRVMKAWGFTYKTEFVWAKDKVGTGYWNRNRHEVLMVGTRGNVPAPAPGQQCHSVIEAAVGEHSQKPEIFGQMIEQMFPNVPKVELFARASREGWDTWGNEVEIAAAPPLVEGTKQITEFGSGDVHHTPPFVAQCIAKTEIGYHHGNPADQRSATA